MKIKSHLHSMQSTLGGNVMGMGGNGVWEVGCRNRFSEGSDEGCRQ